MRKISLKQFNKTTFKERVREVVKRIPKGQTLSYKEVAARAGSYGAARAVGNIMKSNADPKVPCHRVVRADGRPCGYNGGGHRERLRRLEAERKR